MRDDLLLKSHTVCKQILENYAEDERKINFTSLQKKISIALGQTIPHKDFESILATVNGDSWQARKVILTVLVRCNHGLPGMKLWFQAKALGAISVIPNDYHDQKAITSRLMKDVFSAYKKRQPKAVPEVF
jgi:hypothetical protein